MDNWTCYRGRTQGQDTQADLDRLHKKVMDNLDMLQRQDTGTGYRGRSKRTGHRKRPYGHVDTPQRHDTGTGYRGRSQGQTKEAGHRDRLHRQVTGTSSMGRSQAQFTEQGQDTEAGRRDRIQRQVTGTCQSKVTTHWDKLSIGGHSGSYRGGHGTGHRGKSLGGRSQGQVTEAGQRGRSLASYREKN
jgi:hypothetical protein